MQTGREECGIWREWDKRIRRGREHRNDEEEVKTRGGNRKKLVTSVGLQSGERRNRRQSCGQGNRGLSVRETGTEGVGIEDEEEVDIWRLAENYSSYFKRLFTGLIAS